MLEEKVHSILARRDLDSAHVGILLQADATNPDVVLVEKCANQNFIPASNIKIATAAGAYLSLGEDFQYSTAIMADSPGAAATAIWVKGSGDPSFTSKDLMSLVEQAKQAGLRGPVSLTVDGSSFKGAGVDSTWMAEDLDCSYGAPSSALTLDDNIEELHVSAGGATGQRLSISWGRGHVGSPAPVTTVYSPVPLSSTPTPRHFVNVENRPSIDVRSLGAAPPTTPEPAAAAAAAAVASTPGGVAPVGPQSPSSSPAPVQVEDAARWAMEVQVEGTVGAEGCEPSVDVTYSRVHGCYTVTGLLPPGGSDSFPLPVLQPERRFLARLVSALQAAGVRIRSACLAQPPKVIAVFSLAEHRSQRLPAMLERMMHHSNNLYAENLLHTLGARARAAATPPPAFGRSPPPPSPAGDTAEDGARAIQATLAKVGAGKGLKQFDGSGLSRRNLATPRAVVQVLAAMAGRPSFWRCMAVAGRDGTLSKRLVKTEGRVLAKTGTMAGVGALSGYIFLGGNAPPAVFSVLIDSSDLSASRIRSAIDELVTLFDATLRGRTGTAARRAMASPRAAADRGGGGGAAAGAGGSKGGGGGAGWKWLGAAVALVAAATAGGVVARRRLIAAHEAGLDGRPEGDAPEAAGVYEEATEDADLVVGVDEAEALE